MKIVYFDYWTKGTRLFKDIDQSLKLRGHETLFLHMGSFRGKYPLSEELDGIQVRELHYYGTMFIFKALKQIKPDVVIGLNATYVGDRAMVLACRKLNIKSVFLISGYKPVDDQLDVLIKSWKRKNKLGRKLAKVWHYKGSIAPNYIYSVFKANPARILNLHFLRVLWSYFSNPAVANILPSFTDELLHDQCLIYSKRFLNFYQQLGYPRDQIHIVGNPELDTLWERIEKNDFSPEQLPEELQDLHEEGYALYLEESFPESFMGNWDEAYRNKHLQLVADQLNLQGYKMVVKLHPNTKRETIHLKGASLIEQADLFTLVYYSKFCIGHITSTLLIPMLLNKPILIPKWDHSGDLFDLFKGSKAVNYWERAEDPVDLHIFEQARKDYIKENIGITSGKAVERIVDTLLEPRP